MVQINSLRDTTDLGLRRWAQETQQRINTYINSVYFHVSAATNLIGKHPSNTLTTAPNNVAYTSIVVPHSVTRFREVTIRLIATTTGSFNYTVNLAYGGVGDAHGASTQTVTDDLSVSNGLVSEIDITDLFEDQNGDDQIGCELIINSLTTTTAVDVLGVYLKYI